MLLDVFGQVPAEGEYFRVDHAAVAAYKRKVQANMHQLRSVLAYWLQPAPEASPFHDTVVLPAPRLTVKYVPHAKAAEARSMVNRGVDAARQGNNAEARRLWADAARISPSLSMAHGNLARSHVHDGNTKHAGRAHRLAFYTAQASEKHRYCQALAQHRAQTGASGVNALLQSPLCAPIAEPDIHGPMGGGG